MLLKTTNFFASAICLAVATAAYPFDDVHVRIQPPIAILDEDGSSLVFHAEPTPNNGAKINHISVFRRGKASFDIAEHSDEVQDALSTRRICYFFRSTSDQSEVYFVIETCTDQITDYQRSGDSWSYTASLVTAGEFGANSRRRIEDLVSGKIPGRLYRIQERVVDEFNFYIAALDPKYLHPEDINTLGKMVAYFNRNPALDDVAFLSMAVLENQTPLMTPDPTSPMGKIYHYIDSTLLGEASRDATGVKQYFSSLFMLYNKVNPSSHGNAAGIDSEVEYFKALFGLATAQDKINKKYRESREQELQHEGVRPLRRYFETCDGYSNNGFLRDACLDAALGSLHLVDTEAVVVSDARTIASKIANAVQQCADAASLKRRGIDRLFLLFYRIASCDTGGCSDPVTTCDAKLTGE